MGQTIRRRAVPLCFVLAAAASAPPCSAQTASPRTAEQIKASFEAHKNEFDYLLGDWEFTAESEQFGKFRGFWSARRIGPPRSLPALVPAKPGTGPAR